MGQRRRAIGTCGKPALLLGIVVILTAFGRVGGTGAQVTGPAPVPLGTAGAFAVLAASTVTNTGPSVINGDVGLSPGSSITGFPLGIVNGTIHQDDAVAAQAQSDLTIAYNDAAGRLSTSAIAADLAGQTLTPGVYTSASSIGLSGILTLDGQGDENAIFIFQAGSTLTTAPGSQVLLIGSARACNVVWQVGSSATLGSATTFSGNILANLSISLNAGSVVDGSVLAGNGAVTLISNTVSRSVCAAPATTTSTTPGVTTTGPGSGATTTTTVGITTAGTVPVAGTTPGTGPGGGTPTGTVRPTLPRTGAGPGRMAAAAGGLVLMGFGLTVVAARHRTKRYRRA